MRKTWLGDKNSDSVIVLRGVKKTIGEEKHRA